MILEIMVGIEGKAHFVIHIIKTSDPTAQMITTNVGIDLIHLVIARCKEGINVILEASTYLQGFRWRQMERTAKFAGHLKSKFHTERMFIIGRTDTQIARLAVIANILGIMHLVPGPILLKMAIGKPSVRKMSLDGQPSSQARYVPIIGKRQAHLGNRSGIDTESLRAATEFHVLKLHGLLLLSESQDAVLVAHLGVALLDDEVAGIMQWNRQVEAITYPPLLIGIHTQRTLHTTTRITIGRAERT